MNPLEKRFVCGRFFLSVAMFCLFVLLKVNLHAGEQYNSWMLTHFTLAERGEGKADPTLDPDKDGVTNIWEYVFGCDPMDAASRSELACSVTGNDQAVTFRLLRGIEDLEWKVQMSHDLKNWVDNTDVPTQTADGAVDITTVTNNIYHFFRVSVTVKDGFAIDSDQDTVNDFFEYAMIHENPADELNGLADVNATNDQDADGLTDVQEFGFGMNRHDKLDILTDVDGDRIPNWFEYKRGSDLVDATSKPTFDATVDPQNVDVANGIYATIQDAIDAVPSTQNSEPYYSIIRIVSGTYGAGNTVPSDKRITFLADQGGSGVLLTSKKNGMDIFDVASEMSVFDGFEITQKGATNDDKLPFRYHPPVDSGMIRLHNCLIHEGVSRWGAILVDQGILIADHVTLINNGGGDLSKAIYLGANTELHLRNSIVWGNVSRTSELEQINRASQTTSQIFTRDSWIEGGQFGAYATDPRMTPHGMLTHNSPARNACAAIDMRAADIHGEVIQGAADAGADEFIDTDFDLLPDHWETIFGGMAMTAAADTDENSGDALDNLAEYRYGTSPLLKDTDGDGRDDGEEVTSGTSPHILVQGFLDTDGDRVPDVFEIERGSDPLLASSVPSLDATVDPDDDFAMNTYASIQEAIDAVPSYTVDADPYYAVIRVVAGEHLGKISIPCDKQICFLADQGLEEVVIKDGVKSTPIILFSTAGGSGGGPGEEPTTTHTPLVTKSLIENYSLVSCFDGFVFAPNDEEPEEDAPIFFRAAPSAPTNQGKELTPLEAIVYQDSTFHRGMLRLNNCIVRGFELPDHAAFLVKYGSIMLDHLTVTDLNAHGYAKVAALVHEESDIYLRNSVLWANTGYAAVSLLRDYPSVSEITLLNSWIEGGEFGANDSDPRVIPEGYLIENSPARNAGATLDGASRDIQGEAYIAQRDSGADEYLDADSDGRPDWLVTQGQDYLLDGNGDGIDLWDALFTHGIDDEVLDYDDDGIPNDYEISQGWDPSVANPLADFLTYLASGAATPQFTVFTELK